MSWWETYVHTIIGAGSPLVTPGPPPPPLDPRIWPNDIPFRLLPDGHREVPASAFNSWWLDHVLLAAYGSEQSFNLYLTGGGFADPQWLFGGVVRDGVLDAGRFDGPIAGASYAITLPYDRFGDAYMNRDIWPALFADGLATGDVLAAGLDSEVAYRGTGALLFGLDGAVPATPEPASLLLMALAAGPLVGAARRRRRGRAG